jgi:glycosyltransferase involved in cell wall biosynthesis
MKRIIIFNANSSLYGAERGLLNLTRTLEGKFDVTVVLPKRGPLVEKIGSLNINLKFFPLPIVVITFSPFYYLFFVILSVINIIYFSLYVIYKDIDIICTNSLHLIFPALVAKITHRRHIWYIREFSSSNMVNTALGLVAKILSDQLICQSQTIKQRLYLGKQAKVIYEPLAPYDYNTYEPALLREEFNLPQTAILISIISRLHPSKGQYEFIEGIKKLLKESPNLFLLIVGDISYPTLKVRLYKRRIRRLIEREGLKNVILVGFRMDIDKFLCTSNLCIFPFRREEPYGYAVAEALAFNKPTFFPYQGGLQEVHQIFGKGEELDIEEITKRIFNLGDLLPKKVDKLYIPKQLTMEVYKGKVLEVFGDESS